MIVRLVRVSVAFIRSQMFFKIGVLKNFTNFTGKHFYRTPPSAASAICLYKPELVGISSNFQNSFLLKHLWANYL